MSLSPDLLLMTTDPQLASTVSSALQGNGHVLAPGAVPDSAKLTGRLEREAVPIVLVDLDPQPRQVLSDIERLSVRFPAVRFVALSNAIDNQLLLDAMQAGIRHVLAKPSLTRDLGGVLSRLAIRSSGGQLFTILSASGGCGATTLAINLSFELGAQQPDQPALLIDLDVTYGAASPYLGLEPHYSIDHVLTHEGQIDASLIGSVTTTHSPKLHLLASPASTNSLRTPAFQWDHLEAALLAARQAYRHVVVDAPHLPLELAGRLARASARTLLLFQLTVKDVHVARAMLNALSQLQIPSERIIPVAMRYARRQMVSLEDATKALGNVSIVPVRNDYDSAIHAMNFGQPLAEAAPRSALRRDIQGLLQQLQTASRPVAS